jgi:hypothetical protein
VIPPRPALHRRKTPVTKGTADYVKRVLPHPSLTPLEMPLPMPALRQQ